MKEIRFNAVLYNGYMQDGLSLNVPKLGWDLVVPVYFNFSDEQIGSCHVTIKGNSIFGNFKIDANNELVAAAIKPFPTETNIFVWPSIDVNFDESSINDGIVDKADLLKVVLGNEKNIDPFIPGINLISQYNSTVGYELTPDLIHELWNKLPIEKQRVLLLVASELEKAENKFPSWPSDVIHAAAIVAEENGELQMRALQAIYEPMLCKLGDLKKEAIQTAAMGVRFVLNMPTYHPGTTKPKF